ncbi:Tonneau 1b [Musa troglodytarum]|uniref:Tonneau 1b n=1 Tax=Musa troglodytarum TaxID=320322 RepID=A0A9E7JRU7_9LILI|nr:Tonneau 1b [Musa troglodytarum]
MDDIVKVVLLAGRLLTALICEYLDWAGLGHTLKVYLPECNLVHGETSSKTTFALSQKPSERKSPWITA